MGSVGSLLSGAAAQIGRYFSILSVLPSGLLVAYVYGLAASGAWSGRPDWEKAADALADLGLGEILQLALVGVLVGLILQPLQYALTQFLEGYWGTSRPAVRAMAWRVRHHQLRRARLLQLRGQALDGLRSAGQDPREVVVRPEKLDLLVLEGEADRLSASYPVRPNDVRPTRLGNVLRRYEANAGTQYELSAVVVVPRLAQVAPPEDIAYLDDQRIGLDLAVRLTFVAALATLASVAFLWRAGPWLLVALAPYVLTYTFYRGAVVAAGGYGSAFTVLIDLNRFALYERLGLRRPPNSEAERTRNRELMRLLRGERSAAVQYAPAEPPRETVPDGR